MYRFEYGVKATRDAWYDEPEHPSTREEAYAAGDRGRMRLVKIRQYDDEGWVPSTVTVQASNRVFHDGFDNELRAGDMVLYSTNDDISLLPAVIIKMLPEKLSLQALSDDRRTKIYRPPAEVILIPHDRIEL